MSDHASYVLSSDQKDHFMKHGYLRLTDCFSREKATSWTDDMWTRLGYSPTDQSTWASERVNMPSHRSEPVRTFAPKVWAAICELLGGEDRVSEESAVWTDALIVNLGTEESVGKAPDPRELSNWHVDGDFFVHFLDSPEQSLLVIPLFSDIQKHGGGTMVCPDAIPLIAQHLYDHPEGVSPYMIPRGQPLHQSLDFYNSIIKRCCEFHEMTGAVGDVILLHPLMCHSASVNSLRIPRIITNPRVQLKEPFNFDREDANQYSLVERKTLQALGRDRLRGWRITTERDPVVPERLRIQREIKELELQRLKEALERQDSTNGICCLRERSSTALESV